MYSREVRAEAARLRAEGLTVSQVSRALGVSRWAIAHWEANPGEPGRRSGCAICDGNVPPPRPYAALLGFYLGDGYIARAPRYFSLRITCDTAYPGIIRDVEASIVGVRPGKAVFRVDSPGWLSVVSNWVHWPCHFPQHGPGRKHERPIVLEGWQTSIVTAHPEAFLRGLFHSDGCRARNWTQRIVAGEMKRYDYPRWQFSNRSADIRELCCWALDLVDVPWRQSNASTISVSTRTGVAGLDELIGPKS